MSLWLTEDEVFELTGYRYKSRQKAALARMRIPFRTRDGDGKPLVLRNSLQPLTRRQKSKEPRLDLVQ